MKATQTKSIFGISGELEFLALKTLENEVVEANKLAEDFNDAGCNEVEEINFNEADYLDDARQGAGYESEWAEF